MGLEDGGGMRLKSHCCKLRLLFRGYFLGGGQDFLVAEMDAIEVADGKDTGFCYFLNV
jgi:hypothetical protein